MGWAEQHPPARSAPHRPWGNGSIKVGFIGLGDQGGPMAEMVVQAGFQVTVWARRLEVSSSFASRGAEVAEAPAALAAQCELLGLCVTGDADVRALLLEQGALAAMAPGSIVAIHSTIAPALCRELAAFAASRSVSLIDAPVSGSGHAARARTLLLMVGGDDRAFDRARPVFETFAGTILRMGPVGSAMSAKLVNNLLACVHIGHAYRALELGQGLGLDLTLLRAAVLAGTGRSFAMEAIERFRDPVRARHVRRILEKDVTLALAEIGAAEAADWGPHAEAGLEALNALAEGELTLPKGLH
jgi:3-hydroxyisobutyrate dehydrogenase-like beta-hydroxyacid dehydrogenase